MHKQLYVKCIYKF